MLVGTDRTVAEPTTQQLHFFDGFIIEEKCVQSLEKFENNYKQILIEL